LPLVVGLSSAASLKLAYTEEDQQKSPLLRKSIVFCGSNLQGDTLHGHLKSGKNILGSDESKFNLYSDDGKGYVRRPINQRYNKRYTTATVKFGGGNIMVWGCFSWHGLGPLHRITDKMDQFQYKEILETVMLPHAQENLPENWQFQQDNDPKHTAKSVKKLDK
jgi:hypothetical protein